MRVANDRPTDDGGHLHPIDDVGRRNHAPPPPPRKSQSPHDWATLQQIASTGDLAKQQRAELAQRLGVDVLAVVELGTGWLTKGSVPWPRLDDHGKEHPQPSCDCWSVPMYDSTGAICGMRLRPVNGDKFAVQGSANGCFRPLAPLDQERIVIVTESESDAMAGATMGFQGIACSGAGSGHDVVSAYLQGLDVCICFDADTAGRAGAAKLRDRLLPIARTVRTIEPPEEHKDLRGWLQAGASLADLRAAIDAAATQQQARRSVSPADVVRRWQQEGALHHYPTGIPVLDEMTGGGPTYSARTVLIGPPDGGKTVLVVQLLDHYAGCGMVAGILAVDEESDDVTTRLLQRRGWRRSECEERDPGVLRRMAEAIADLPVMIYGPEWTIEDAGDDLARIAAARGMPAVLGVDSLQTATCAAEANASSRYETVSARVQALRTVSSRHRMLTIATSEMSRAAYRDPENQIDDLAAAKESGAIEYSARLLLSLRSVPREQDLVALRVVKNKLGPVTNAAEQGIVLRLDRATQTLTPAMDYTAPTGDGRNPARAAAAERRTLGDAAVVAAVLSRKPGLSLRQLRAAAAAAGQMGHGRCDIALERLDAAVVVRTGGPRGAGHHYLAGDRVGDDILKQLAIADRPGVLAAKPPEPPPEAASDDSVPGRAVSVPGTLDGSTGQCDARALRSRRASRCGATHADSEPGAEPPGTLPEESTAKGSRRSRKAQSPAQRRQADPPREAGTK